MYKSDFPIFKNSPLVYLDSGASAQKPESVLQAMDTFYRTCYSNVHRGQCAIAVQATEQYEKARQTVAEFIHTTPKNIVFTKGATEAINLVATGFSSILKPGDEVMISIAEHHANFVPWQQACVHSGATFHVVDVLPDGRLDMEDFYDKLSEKTKIVAITQLSNVLGVENPIKEIVAAAHEKGALVLVDGAQSIAHMPVDVMDLGVDFFVFSSHKLYGPTGIGVLYGTSQALEDLPPYQFGGDMIEQVTVQKTTFAPIPARLEAGTPAFVEAVGLGAAVAYVSKIGMDKIAAHEQKLTDFLLDELNKIEGIEIIGGVYNQGLVSFNIHGIHASDLSFALSKQNICVRVGHHCAMPIHLCFKTAVSMRVSFGLYNGEDDVKALITALKKALSFF